MTTDCDRWEDALIGMAAGRPDPALAAGVRAHLEGCARCREELDLLRRVATAATTPPPGLEARIRDAVRGAAAPGRLAIEHRRPRRPDWRRVAFPLAAAAAIALLWIGLPGVPVTDPRPEPAEVTLAADLELYGTWPAAGEEVAGAPVLSDLSDEALEALLEEMDP